MKGQEVSTSDLMYSSYVWNRRHGMSAKGASTIYPNAQSMEQRFKQEIKQQLEKYKKQ